MQEYRVIPFVSVGVFKFDTPIKEYLQNGLYNYVQQGVQEDGYECYNIVEPQLSITCEYGNIAVIRSHKYCYMNNQNLIGLSLSQCKKILNAEPDSHDFVQIGYDDEKPQTVYDFDSLGLQIWVANRKVVTVSCFGFIEDDPIEGACPQSA
jgi:hypothetical protein